MTLVCNCFETNLVPVTILVIIAVVVVVYIMVNRGANGAKKRSLDARSVLDDLQMNSARGVEIATSGPVARSIGQSKITLSNTGFNPDSIPAGTPGSLQKRGSIARRFIIPDDLGTDE